METENNCTEDLSKLCCSPGKIVDVDSDQDSEDGDGGEQGHDQDDNHSLLDDQGLCISPPDPGESTKSSVAEDTQVDIAAIVQNLEQRFSPPSKGVAQPVVSVSTDTSTSGQETPESQPSNATSPDSSFSSDSSNTCIRVGNTVNFKPDSRSSWSRGIIKEVGEDHVLVEHDSKNGTMLHTIKNSRWNIKSLRHSLESLNSLDHQGDQKTKPPKSSKSRPSVTKDGAQRRAWTKVNSSQSQDYLKNLKRCAESLKPNSEKPAPAEDAHAHEGAVIPRVDDDKALVQMSDIETLKKNLCSDLNKMKASPLETSSDPYDPPPDPPIHQVDVKSPDLSHGEDDLILKSPGGMMIGDQNQNIIMINSEELSQDNQSRSWLLSRQPSLPTILEECDQNQEEAVFSCKNEEIFKPGSCSSPDRPQVRSSCVVSSLDDVLRLLRVSDPSEVITLLNQSSFQAKFCDHVTRLDVVEFIKTKTRCAMIKKAISLMNKDQLNLMVENVRNNFIRLASSETGHSIILHLVSLNINHHQQILANTLLQGNTLETLLQSGPGSLVAQRCLVHVEELRMEEVLGEVVELLVEMLENINTCLCPQELMTFIDKLITIHGGKVVMKLLLEVIMSEENLRFLVFNHGGHWVLETVFITDDSYLLRLFSWIIKNLKFVLFNNSSSVLTITVLEKIIGMYLILTKFGIN